MLDLGELNGRVRTAERVFDETRARYFWIEDFHNVKLERREVYYLAGIITDSARLVLAPRNMNFGFAVGFEIGHVGVAAVHGKLAPYTQMLRFLEKQLPDDYDFASFEEAFMREDNLKLLASARRDRLNGSRSSYQY